MSFLYVCDCYIYVFSSQQSLYVRGAIVMSVNTSTKFRRSNTLSCEQCSEIFVVVVVVFYNFCNILFSLFCCFLLLIFTTKTFKTNTKRACYLISLIVYSFFLYFVYYWCYSSYFLFHAHDNFIVFFLFVLVFISPQKQKHNKTKNIIYFMSLLFCFSRG
jgi:hypothetical protein